MIEIVNYTNAIPCVFCGENPTYREFNREPSYVFCANEDCIMFDRRLELKEWNENHKRIRG